MDVERTQRLLVRSWSAAVHAILLARGFSRRWFEMSLAATHRDGAGRATLVAELTLLSLAGDGVVRTTPALAVIPEGSCRSGSSRRESAARLPAAGSGGRGRLHTGDERRHRR